MEQSLSDSWSGPGVKDRWELAKLDIRQVDIYWDSDRKNSTVDNIPGLLEAIFDDCAAGRILPGYYLEASGHLGSMRLFLQDDTDIWVNIYDTFTSTVSYLEDHAVDRPEG